MCKMELCCRLDTTFYKNSIIGNWKSNGHDYNPNKINPFWLVEPTHSKRRHPSLLTKNHFIFNLTTISYLISALNVLIKTLLPSTTSLLTLNFVFSLNLLLIQLPSHFIAQNYLFSTKQQPYVLGRIFAWISTNPSARNSVWSFSSTNGHPSLSLADGGGDAKRFQRTSYDASSHHREPTWNPCKWWRKCLGMWEWTTPRFLTLDLWHNQLTISLGKRDLWRTQLLSKRMRGSLSQELQSANHQDNHRRWRQDQLCAPLRTCKNLQLLNSSLICKENDCCLVFCNLISCINYFYFNEIGTKR